MNLDYLLEYLTEISRAQNIVKIGRVKRIRRRIRRDSKGKITVQRNRIRSGIKGYRATGKGGQVKRITATERIKKARLLKRSWKTTRRYKTTPFNVEKKVINEKACITRTKVNKWAIRYEVTKKLRGPTTIRTVGVGTSI